MQHVITPGRRGLALLSLLGCFLGGGLGCGSDGGRGAAPARLDLDDVPPGSWQQTGSDPCLSPDVGCPCEDEGVVRDCGTVTEMFGDYKICYPGTRTCGAGVWGECTADTSLGGEVLPAD